MTQLEFANRHDLWLLDRPSEHLPTPAFGQLGVTRNCFDAIWSCLQFLCQPETRPDEMPSKDYQWMLVDNFIKLFNAHCEENFDPSAIMCGNEFLGCWCGNGGDWITLQWNKSPTMAVKHKLHAVASSAL